MEANGSAYYNPNSGNNNIGFMSEHSSAKEEIVISGIAGKFPNCNDVYELCNNLFDKIDLLSKEKEHSKLREDCFQRIGKVNNLDKFDAGYFGMQSSQVHCMDPAIRLLLEKATEAVIDAGINPCTLAGTNTGVYLGISALETENDKMLGSKHFKGESLLGCARNQAAQRISYHLQLNGPSIICDTACSSSAFALELAYRDMRMGKCDQAIVGGVNLCLFGSLFSQFSQLGMLSADGVLRAFDEDANGYVRAEAICAVLLQKAKNAKRIYCKIVHVKVNSEGYKSEGITHPSRVSQIQFFEEFYEECGVSPTTVSFLEAHGTGTKVGDPEEAFAIASVFCNNRPEPLLIGSIKSNIGHTEGTSALCSLIKIICAMETGYIAPNINFNNPNREIAALHDGRLHVVTEKTTLDDNKQLIVNPDCMISNPWHERKQLMSLAINNFGFGGTNAHFLLSSNKNLKIGNGQPEDDLPRLICASGRTLETINSFFDDIKNRKLDAEYIRLYHDIFCNTIPNQQFRGFLIVDKNGELKRSMNVHSAKRQICLMIDEIDDDKWLNFGKTLTKIPAIANATKRIQNKIEELALQNDFTVEQNNEKEILYKNFLSILTIQISLLEMIREIGFEPDFYLGSNIGDIICAYYDELISLEQLLRAVHQIALSKFKFDHQSRDKSDTALLTNNNKQLSKMSGFQKVKAELICSHKSPKSTLVEELLKSPDTQITSETVLDKILVVYIGSKNSTFPNTLCLLESNASDPVLSLMENLGRLYERGIDLDLAKLYPEIKFPVSKGTPMISPLIKWDYNQEWYVINRRRDHLNKRSDVYVVDMKYDWAYLKGHAINGDLQFPVAGYLYLVWDHVSKRNLTQMETCNVVFENIIFFRTTDLSKRNQVTYNVSVKSNGEFEVTEGDILLVTGNIHQIEETHETFTNTEYLWIKDDKERLPLLQKDIYKELKLRGHNYTGVFQSIKACNTLVTKGVLNWEGNWVALIEGMLQMNILGIDSKNLHMPGQIGKLLINPKMHETHINDDGTMNVYCNKEANITSCGGVEIVGLCVNQISKTKLLVQPVLESYEFVPNEGELNLEQCMEVNTQIILEDTQETVFKMVEVFHDQPKIKGPLCQIIQKVLDNQPLARSIIKLLSKNQLHLPNIVTENESLSSISNCLLVIGIEFLTNTKMLMKAMNAIQENGFIMSRQDRTFKLTEKPANLEIITCYKIKFETIVLLKKSARTYPTILNIPDPTEDLTWIPKLQQLRKLNNEIIIISENVECNGILGFTKCLRREFSDSKIRCFSLMDKSIPKFNISDQFYQNQMKKGMAINVYKDGQWGTYRHLLNKFSDFTEAQSELVNVTVPEDFTSLMRIEEHQFTEVAANKNRVLVNIYYSTLNFRNVLTTSTRLPINIAERSRIVEGGFQGIGFAGRDLKGKRVFGMLQTESLSAICMEEPLLICDVPDEWTMAEAVTIPFAYSAVLYAFVKIAHIQKRQTVLIHNGSGGIGQAAIYIAIHYGCKIFTTVETKEKKTFILELFPQIKEDHIGNSNDTTFEQMILDRTHGRGVDIALNSLAGEKMHATIRCVAKTGCYIEIGSTNLLSNNTMSMHLFERGIKAAGIMTDLLMKNEERKYIEELLIRHIKSGAVKPLNKYIFGCKDIESVYRFLAEGKHTGEVVIEIRQEEDINRSVCLPAKQYFKYKPAFNCDPNSTYIIIGGLGGIGLELVDWLIVKSCRKLILVSRHGLKTGYQAFKLRRWKKYVSTLHVFTENVTTMTGCEKLLKKANEMGPVDGIFNLAAVLHDSAFENQTVETFMVSLIPKANVTLWLDKASRKLCPRLRYFVVFSSVSCGRGYPGQTNYGLSNSIIENICEKRKSDGFPALAVQWGAVADVGIVADKNDLDRDVVINGTLPQRIVNCLEVLDKFLCGDKVIVSSCVIAEKLIFNTVYESICNILGIKSMENINEQLTLPQVGMDSITMLEIKQIIEGELKIHLIASELRSMTLLRLKNLSHGNNVLNILTAENDWLNFLLKFVNFSEMPSLEADINEHNQKYPEVSFLPGIDGLGNGLELIISKLKGRVNVCQYLLNYRNDEIQSIAEEVLKIVKKTNSSFTLVAYSFGCLVALEVIALLESGGCIGKAIFIDGSAEQMKSMIKKIYLMQDEEAVKVDIFMKILHNTSFVLTTEIEAELASHKSVDEKIDYVVNYSKNKYSRKYLQNYFYVIYNRIKAVINYEYSCKEKLKSKAILLRPKTIVCPSDDSNFFNLFENPVQVKTYDGDQESILRNSHMINDINDFI